MIDEDKVKEDGKDVIVIATATKTKEKQTSCPLLSYIPPHQMIAPSDTRKDKSQCFKCNTPNQMLSNKCKDKSYTCLKKLMSIVTKITFLVICKIEY